MKNLFLFAVLGVMLVASSCRILNPSVMLKTPKDFAFDKTPTDSLGEYKISSNDMLDFRAFTNDGFKLIDLTGEGQALAQNTINQVNYLVDVEGKAKLPLIGTVYLKGLTVREAEKLLEEKYSQFYNKPFVILRVTNKRVIIFPGSGGTASVVPLINNNTSLMEALAYGGGITTSGKAYKVKVVRETKNKQEVYLMDLSTIEGLQDAKMIMQAGDIVYVEPRLYLTSDILAELTPIISVLSTAILFITILNRAN